MKSVYTLRDPRVPTAIRYVGKTTHTLTHRLSSHLCPSSRSRHSHLSRWLLSLHSANVQPIIELLEAVAESDDLDAREIFWIAELRAQGCNLVNGTNGGDGAAYWTGRKRSPEMVAKVAAKLRGRRHPQDCSCGLHDRGVHPPMCQCGVHSRKPWTPEARAKLKGRVPAPKTPAGLRRLAEKASRQTGSLNGRWRTDITTAQIQRRMAAGESIRAIARDLGVSHTMLRYRLRRHQHPASTRAFACEAA